MWEYCEKTGPSKGTTYIFESRSVSTFIYNTHISSFKRVPAPARSVLRAHIWHKRQIIFHTQQRVSRVRGVGWIDHIPRIYLYTCHFFSRPRHTKDSSYTSFSRERGRMRMSTTRRREDIDIKYDRLHTHDAYAEKKSPVVVLNFIFIYGIELSHVLKTNKGGICSKL